MTDEAVFKRQARKARIAEAINAALDAARDRWESMSPEERAEWLMLPVTEAESP